MGYMGLGKQRSTFGRWSDKMRLSQQDLIVITGVNKNTISSLCNEIEYNPFDNTKIRVIGSLRKRGYAVTAGDFWDE
jgi:putative transcriptional regulator